MIYKDKLSKHYKEILEGSYDCLDRIVLNGYFIQGCIPGGFRNWFRALKGSDNNLNNNTLMKMAGRFGRRTRAFCKSKHIPLIYFKGGERKHEKAEELIPKDKNFTGLFAVFVARAPGMVWDVKEFGEGKIDIRKKKPASFINHYSFHIIDKVWGHITIKIAGHPPFTAQIILNGHEWVERQEKAKRLSLEKEGNCFTRFSNGEALSRIADTLSIQKGQLESVCNRWIYKCLWFGLNQQEQSISGFKYSYSIYQVEYSRNLLFNRGTVLDEIYENIITLTRPRLGIKRLTSIVGMKKRPHHRKFKRPEIRIEKSEYNLTVFKILFGKLTLKLYDKGERILRAEVVVHNIQELRCKRSVGNFPEVVSKLKVIMNNFMDTLQYTHVSLLKDGSFERLASPTKKGKNRLAGIDINKKRNLSMMETTLALAVRPGGYKVADVAEMMKTKMKKSYTTRQAAYDMRKLRGKKMIEKIEGTTKYRTTKKGMETIIAILVLTQKTIPAVLSAINNDKLSENPEQLSTIDWNIIKIRESIKEINQQNGIKIAA